MADSDKNPPEYPPLSKNQIWEHLRREFEEGRSFHSSVYIQTRESWIGEKIKNKKKGRDDWVSKVPEIFDEEIGFEVPVDYFPYISEEFEEELTEIIGTIEYLTGELEPYFKEGRKVDLQFVSLWGSFCGLTSKLETLYFDDRENVLPDRKKLSGTISQSKEAQKLWFSHVYLDLEKKNPDLPRIHLEKRVEKIIKKHIRGGFGGADEFGKEWFEQFFAKQDNKICNNISSAFRKNKLPVKSMRKRVQASNLRIPPIDI